MSLLTYHHCKQDIVSLHSIHKTGQWEISKIQNMSTKPRISKTFRNNNSTNERGQIQ